MKVGYLIPDFPGQTHSWMWREIVWMRRWGIDVSLFSTRRPGERDRARHAFAPAATQETQYLWPPDPVELAASLAWATARHPDGLARAIALAATLKGPSRSSVLALVPVSAVLARRIERMQITHLHAHSCASSAILCMMVKRLIGTPFSMTLNANIEWWGGAMAEKFGDAAFTMVITDWLLEQMKRDFPSLSPEQTRLGRIGVDTQHWRSQRARQPRPGPSRLVTVARLHASKGHDVLLTAFKQLAEAGRSITLTMVGDGPERPALEAQVARDGLGSLVTFTGSLSEDQIIAQLDDSDVFALASHAEPLGVVYMEAMSMGLATVGTKAGGVPEIITDGHDGLLVPPADPAALAAAIGRLLDDPALRDRLGSAGRATIEKRFDARFGAAALYERLCGQAPVEAPAAMSGGRVSSAPKQAFDEYFEHALIINLPERRDRREGMKAELAKIGLSEQPGHIEFFPATRPLPEEAVGWPSVGARGCFMSHLAVLKRAQREGWPRVLVMEDDLEVDPRLAMWQDQIVDQLRGTPWDFVYLGHPLRLPPPAHPPAVQPHSAAFPLAHFYAVSAAVLQPLIEYLEAVEQRPDGHPDGGAMHVDGAYCMFRERHPEVVALVANPSLGAQRSSPSDISPKWWDRFESLSGLARQAGQLRRRLTS